MGWKGREGNTSDEPGNSERSKRGGEPVQLLLAPVSTVMLGTGQDLVLR